MEVQIEIKSVYGKDLIYPANITAETFLLLTGKKTFSREDIKIIKRLGFTVTILPPTL